MINEISATRITQAVASLCIESNKTLPQDIENLVKTAAENESNSTAREIMCDLCRNIDAANELNIPICQDTGMTVVFLRIGQDVHITDGLLVDAINEGVAKGYEDGLLRFSVVADPLNRINTGNNTPAVIHTEIVEGSQISITVAPKGFGSENMSGIRMLTPSQGKQGVIDAVLEIVKNAGSNPCPPMVIGVGIGGDFEHCAYLAKKALSRSAQMPNNNDYYAELERELLVRINNLGIGPQGFGGDTTALALNIEYAPTHIAGLPVAVNIGCHVTRHKTMILR